LARHPQIAYDPQLFQMFAQTGDIDAVALADAMGRIEMAKLADQFRGMSPARQQEEWLRLDGNTRDLLARYEGVLPEEEGGGGGILGSLIDVVDGPAGFVNRNVLEPIGSAIPQPVRSASKDVVGSTLHVLDVGGRLPGHLFRTTHKIFDDMGVDLNNPLVAAAFLGLVVGTGGLGAAAMGGSFLAASGGALLGSAAGVAATGMLVAGPSRFVEAWHATADGESYFSRSALEGAEELLEGDLDMLAIAKEIAGGATPFDMAEGFYDPGTPEFDEVVQHVSVLMGDPLLQAAVNELNLGKQSMGRWFATAFTPFRQGTKPYNLVSGAMDATALVIADPFLIVGKAAKASRLARMGIRDGDNMAYRINEMWDPARGGSKRMGVFGARGETVREGMENSFNRIAQGFDGTPAARAQLQLEMPQITGLLEPMRQYAKTHKFETAHDVKEFFVSRAGIAELGRGKTAVRRDWIELPLMSRRGLKRAERKAWFHDVIEFAGDPDRQVVGDKFADLVEAGDLWLPTHGIDAIPPDASKEEIADLIRRGVVDMSNFESQGISRMRELYEGNSWFRLIFAKGRFNPVRNAAKFTSSLTHQIPFGGAVIDLYGSKGTQEMINMVEMSGMMSHLPASVKRAWIDEFLTSDEGARIIGVRAFLHGTMASADLVADDASALLVDRIIRGLDQAYMTGDQAAHLVRHQGDLAATAGVMIDSDLATKIRIPTFLEMLGISRKYHWTRRAHGWANPELLEKGMTLVWKPSVLLRIGFIPRAGGEELLSTLMRMPSALTVAKVTRFGADEIEFNDLNQATTGGLLPVSRKLAQLGGRRGRLETARRSARTGDRTPSIRRQWSNAYEWSDEARELTDINIMHKMLTEGANYRRALWQAHDGPLAEKLAVWATMSARYRLRRAMNTTDTRMGRFLNSHSMGGDELRAARSLLSVENPEKFDSLNALESQIDGLYVGRNVPFQERLAFREEMDIMQTMLRAGGAPARTHVGMAMSANSQVGEVTSALPLSGNSDLLPSEEVMSGLVGGDVSRLVPLRGEGFEEAVKAGDPLFNLQYYGAVTRFSNRDRIGRELTRRGQYFVPQAVRDELSESLIHYGDWDSTITGLNGVFWDYESAPQEVVEKARWRLQRYLAGKRGPNAEPLHRYELIESLEEMGNVRFKSAAERAEWRMVIDDALGGQEVRRFADEASYLKAVEEFDLGELPTSYKWSFETREPGSDPIRHTFDDIEDYQRALQEASDETIDSWIVRSQREDDDLVEFATKTEAEAYADNLRMQWDADEVEVPGYVDVLPNSVPKHEIEELERVAISGEPRYSLGGGKAALDVRESPLVEGDIAGWIKELDKLSPDARGTLVGLLNESRLDPFIHSLNGLREDLHERALRMLNSSDLAENARRHTATRRGVASGHPVIAPVADEHFRIYTPMVQRPYARIYDEMPLGQSLQVQTAMELRGWDRSVINAVFATAPGSTMLTTSVHDAQQLVGTHIPLRGKGFSTYDDAQRFADDFQNIIVQIRGKDNVPAIIDDTFPGYIDVEIADLKPGLTNSPVRRMNTQRSKVEVFSMDGTLTGGIHRFGEHPTQVLNGDVVEGITQAQALNEWADKITHKFEQVLMSDDGTEILPTLIGPNMVKDPTEVSAYNSTLFSAEHVLDAGPKLPRAINAPKFGVADRGSLWHRAMNAGFNSVVSPAIDSIARQPIYTMEYIKAFKALRANLDSLRDGRLVTAARTNVAKQARAVGPFGRVDFSSLLDENVELINVGLRHPALKDLEIPEQLNWVPSPEFRSKFWGLHSRVKDLAEEDELFGHILPILDEIARQRADISVEGLLRHYRQLGDHKWNNFGDFKKTLSSHDGAVPWQLESLDQGQWRTLEELAREDFAIRSQVNTMSAERAFNAVIPYIDDRRLRSQFQEWVGNYIPFHFAQEQFIKRWVRTIADSPEAIRRMQLIYNGMKSSGVVIRDPSAPPDAGFEADIWVMPGSAAATAVVSEFSPLLFGGSARVPIAMPMTGSVKFSVPGLDDPLLPSPGPALGIPLGQLASRFPELRPILDKAPLALDRAEDRTIFDQLVPASVRRFAKATFMWDPDGRIHANHTATAMQYLSANGYAPEEDAPAREHQEFIQRVQNYARSLALTEAIYGFIAPASPSSGDIITGDNPLEFSGDNLKATLGITDEEMNQIPRPRFLDLLRTGLDWDEAVTQFIKENPDGTPWTVFGTQGQTGRALPTTSTSLRWMLDNEDVMRKYTTAAAWLVPHDPRRDAFEWKAYNEQLAWGWRTRKGAEEFYDDLHFAAAVPLYIQIRDEHTERMNEIGSMPESRERSDLRLQENDRWRNESEQFQSMHPVFWEKWRAGEGEARRSKILDEWVLLREDPAINGGARFAELDGLWRIFQLYRAQRAQLTGRRGSEVDRFRNDLEDRARVTMESYVRNHPDADEFYRSVIEPEAF
jgi:hypothetical protein